MIKKQAAIKAACSYIEMNAQKLKQMKRMIKANLIVIGSQYSFF